MPRRSGGWPLGNMKKACQSTTPSTPPAPPDWPPPVTDGSHELTSGQAGAGPLGLNPGGRATHSLPP